MEAKDINKEGINPKENHLEANKIKKIINPHSGRIIIILGQDNFDPAHFPSESDLWTRENIPQPNIHSDQP